MLDLPPSTRSPKTLWPLVVLLNASLLLFGCAGPRLSIVPRSGTGTPDEPDPQSIEQSHEVTVALLTPQYSEDIDELPTFLVAVENRGEEKLLLSESNIKVQSGDRSVQVYTTEAFGQRIEAELQREADEYTGRQAEVFLQTGATRQDPSSAMTKIADAKRANRAAASRESRVKRQGEAARLLATQMIEPGDVGGGLVKLHAGDIQPGELLQIEVALAGEIYLFEFDVSEQ